MDKDKIDTERGDEDIVFVETEMDMEAVSDREKPREVLRKKMEEKGLEWEHAEIIGLFRKEFSLMLEENGKIMLEGKEIYKI